MPAAEQSSESFRFDFREPSRGYCRRNVILAKHACSLQDLCARAMESSSQSQYKGKPASAVGDDEKERERVPGSTNVAGNFPPATPDDRQNKLTELVPVVRRMLEFGTFSRPIGDDG